MKHELHLMTIGEVSAWLKVRPPTLYSWAAAGKLPCYRLNGLIRFAREDIEQWLTTCRDRQVATRRWEEPKRRLLRASVFR